MHQQATVDDALKCLSTQEVVIQHRGIDGFTHHGDKLALLGIDRLLDLKGTDVLAVHLSDAGSTTTQQNGLDTKNGKGNHDQANNDLGHRALYVGADILEHERNSMSQRKERT